MSDLPLAAKNDNMSALLKVKAKLKKKRRRRNHITYFTPVRWLPESAPQRAKPEPTV